MPASHRARLTVHGRVQLLLHMCEANVQPVLSDTAQLIASLAVDGKWILSEKLFFYIFRHSADLQPPPALDPSDAASLSASDQSIAYMLDSATEQAYRSTPPRGVPAVPVADAAAAVAAAAGPAPGFEGGQFGAATLPAPMPPPAPMGQPQSNAIYPSTADSGSASSASAPADGTPHAALLPWSAGGAIPRRGGSTGLGDTSAPAPAGADMSEITQSLASLSFPSDHSLSLIHI